MSSNDHWPAWKVLSVLCGVFGGIGLILGLFGNWTGFLYLLAGMAVVAVGGIVLLVVVKIIGFVGENAGDLDDDGDWFDFD